MSDRLEIKPTHPEPPPVIEALPVRLTAEAPPKKSWVWLHPVSGALILFFDNLFFAPEALTAELGWVVAGPLAFLLTTACVFMVQKFRSRDSFLAAAAKGLFGGLLAGIPLNIAGTVVGSLVLILSGMSALNRKNGGQQGG